MALSGLSVRPYIVFTVRALSGFSSILYMVYVGLHSSRVLFHRLHEGKYQETFRKGSWEAVWLRMLGLVAWDLGFKV